MKQIKAADDESGYQGQDRCAEKKEQYPKQLSRLGVWREIIAQTDQSYGDRDQRNKTDETVEHDREQGARFFVRGFLEQKIALNDIAAGATRQKLIVKHTDQKQPGESRKTQMNLLDLQQNVPAKSGRNFDHYVGQDADDNPAIMGVSDRLRHLGSPVGIVINPVEHRDGDGKLENRDQDFFHSPKRSFQIAPTGEFHRMIYGAHLPDK